MLVFTILQGANFPHPLLKINTYYVYILYIVSCILYLVSCILYLLSCILYLLSCIVYISWCVSHNTCVCMNALLKGDPDLSLSWYQIAALITTLLTLNIMETKRNQALILLDFPWRDLLPLQALSKTWLCQNWDDPQTRGSKNLKHLLRLFTFKIFLEKAW